MRVLLTGGTGLLGSELLVRLLERGHDVTALVRTRSRVGASARVERILGALGGGRLLPRVEVVEVDAPVPPPSTLRGGFEAVVHSAASVKFSATAAELERQNVDTPLRLLAALEAARCEATLHLVSTAYVCGDRLGRWTESQRRAGQSPRNSYEASKTTAEELVESRCAASGRRLVIHRPSIIAGRWHDGRAANFHGVLALARALDTLRRSSLAARAAGEELVIPCRGDDTKNIVPVDWVASAIAALLERDDTAGTFHLTHPDPIRHDDLLETVASEVPVPGVSVRTGPRDDTAASGPSRAQRTLEKALAPFAPYLRGEPLFDRTRLESTLGPAATPPAVDDGYIGRIVRFGLSSAWSDHALEAARKRTAERIAWPCYERSAR